MKKALLIILLFWAGYQVGWAQVSDTICGATGFRNYQKALGKVRLRQSTVEGPQLAAPVNVTYTIPVMFVVYHIGEPTGSGSNIPDQHIQDALDELNRSYSSYYPNSIDTQIRFVLAKRLPDCSSTTGIYRINASSFPNYVTQGITSYNDAFGLAKAYPPFQYTGSRDFITIRIVQAMPFASGFAEMDGGTIFLRRTAVNAGSYTLPHEMGHVLSLYHTFEGSEPENPICPPNTTPTTQGDLVADTDPQQYGDFSCSPMAINTCTGQPFGLLTSNLMNYACGQIFTQGQINRMRSFVASQPSLISSLYGQAPAVNESIVAVTCSLTIGHAPTNYINGISRVRFNTIDFLSELYPTGNIAGNYNDFSCGQKTTLQAGVTYPFSLTAYSQRRKVYIDYNNDGNFNESNELVFNTASGASSITITIPTTSVKNTYLRMRVVVDDGSIAPTACYLPGDPTYGCGEIEDYGVLITSACSQFATVKAGSWSDPTVWSCGQLPSPSDLVTISHLVSIPNAFGANALRIIYQAGGQLIYGPGARLHLGP